MKSLVFLLLFNHPNGTQEILFQSAPMSFVECDTLQREVWSRDYPFAWEDEHGAVPMIDAACVPAN